MASPLEEERAGERVRPEESPCTGRAGGGERQTPYRVPGDTLAEATPDFADLFENAPAGYLVLDASGTICRINRTAATMLGWDADWLIGKPFSRWVENRDRPLLQYHRQRTLLRRDPSAQELRVKTRAGRSLNIRLESVREPGKQGGLRSLMIDVSGDQRSARRMRRLQSQLEQVTRRHTADEFAAGLAHELNQPLGTVVLNCEAALRMLQGSGEHGEECLDALRQATDAAAFASKIIRHLRNFLRNDVASRQCCCVNELTNDVCTLVQSEAGDNDVELNVDIPPGLPTVFAIPVQIEQVLINLVRNSMEALRGRESGLRRVAISAAAVDDDRVQITVVDNGPGVSAEERERLFQPFYTTKEAGMGVGLSISRTIVESHGGQLQVNDAAEGGMAMNFSLPVFTEELHGA